MQYNWPLIGHAHIKRYFERALASGKVHHAYLFEGPEHIGKTTLARMLAKTLLCEGTASQIPCGVCRACSAFEHAAHPDFLLLSSGEEEHIAIAAVRGFIGSMLTRPLLGASRIGMIEEAWRLTPEAANALLKTLEEPGGAVVLFLITHSPLLATIVSRCQRIQFRFVPVAEIQAHLQSTTHVKEIAELSLGCPGRAQMFENQEFYREYVRKVQEVVQLLALDEKERLLKIIEVFGAKDTALRRRTVAREMLIMFEAVLRDCLKIRSGVDRAIPHVAINAEIEQCAARLGTSQIVAMLTRARQAKEFIAANVDARLIFEYLLLANNRV